MPSASTDSSQTSGYRTQALLTMRYALVEHRPECPKETKSRYLGFRPVLTRGRRSWLELRQYSTSRHLHQVGTRYTSRCMTRSCTVRHIIPTQLARNLPSLERTRSRQHHHVPERVFEVNRDDQRGRVLPYHLPCIPCTVGGIGPSTGLTLDRLPCLVLRVPPPMNMREAIRSCEARASSFL